MHKGIFIFLICLLIFPLYGVSVHSEKMDKHPVGIPLKFSLEDLEYRTFRYFWDLADSVSGFIPDRYPTKSFSSITATGFGLSAYLVGVEQKYISRKEAATRVLKTLRFLYKLPQGPDKTGVSGYKGLFYHFLDMRTGLRFKNVELSTIDTGANCHYDR